jgi:hypothetical protein
MITSRILSVYYSLHATTLQKVHPIETQERLFCAQVAVTDLGAGLASTLTLVASSTGHTIVRRGGDKVGQARCINDVAEQFMPHIPQNRGRVIAWADIASVSSV